MSYLSDLTRHQRANVEGAIRAVQSRGWGIKAAYIVTEAAACESGMRVLASANVPESQKYPHDLLSWTSDGLGHDHASCGWLQQQTGTRWTPAGFGRAMNQTTMNSPDGWGTPAELMNPEKSTALFLNRLATHDWQHMTNWEAAQAVQGSAFPDGSNYKSQDARARAIVDALWPTHTGDSNSTTALTGDDMPRIVKDRQTNRRYLLIADRPPIYVSATGAAEYAALWGLPTTLPVVEHKALVDYERRMKSPKSKVQAK